MNKNHALTEHMMQDNMIVVAEALFRRVTDDQRKLIVQASRDMEDAMRPKVIADDARILEQVKAKNIAINEVDKEAFRKAVDGMDAEFPHVKMWSTGSRPSPDRVTSGPFPFGSRPLPHSGGMLLMNSVSHRRWGAFGGYGVGSAMRRIRSAA